MEPDLVFEKRPKLVAVFRRQISVIGQLVVQRLARMPTGQTIERHGIVNNWCRPLVPAL